MILPVRADHSAQRRHPRAHLQTRRWRRHNCVSTRPKTSTQVQTESAFWLDPHHLIAPWTSHAWGHVSREVVSSGVRRGPGWGGHNDNGRWWKVHVRPPVTTARPKWHTHTTGLSPKQRSPKQRVSTIKSRWHFKTANRWTGITKGRSKPWLPILLKRSMNRNTENAKLTLWCVVRQTYSRSSRGPQLSRTGSAATPPGLCTTVSPPAHRQTKPVSIPKSRVRLRCFPTKSSKLSLLLWATQKQVCSAVKSIYSCMKEPRIVVTTAMIRCCLGLRCALWQWCSVATRPDFRHCCSFAASWSRPKLSLNMSFTQLLPTPTTPHPSRHERSKVKHPWTCHPPPTHTLQKHEWPSLWRTPFHFFFCSNSYFVLTTEVRAIWKP